MCIKGGNKELTKIIWKSPLSMPILYTSFFIITIAVMVITWHQGKHQKKALVTLHLPSWLCSRFLSFKNDLHFLWPFQYLVRSQCVNDIGLIETEFGARKYHRIAKPELFLKVCSGSLVLREILWKKEIWCSMFGEAGYYITSYNTYIIWILEIHDAL